MSIANIDYPGGFYRDLSPVQLNYICAINAIGGPDLDTSFTYCEIGCGIGDTSSALAASYPQGNFYGIDLSKQHIARAQSLADDTGLSNITFVAADVAQLDLDTLPDFDFVTLHGLYAWVPAPVQAAIRHFLQQKLKPGGVAYLSYNAMPGWGSVSPLRRYFVDRAKQLEGDLLQRVKRIVAELMELNDHEAPFFRENPVAANVLKNLTTADPRYITHEYLSPYWRPRYFREVYDEMTGCGLQFVAEAGVVESLLEHAVAPAFVERLAAETDKIRRESLRDLIQNRFFRRDLYIKPGAARKPRATLFGLVADPVQVPDTIHVPDAPSITFTGPWFERVKKRLGYRVLTLDELAQDPILAQLGHDQLRENLMLMTVGGFCVPCARRETEPAQGPTDRIRIVPRYNDVLLSRHDWGASSLTLASPVLGSGVTLNGLETVLLISLQRDQTLDWLAAQLQEKGITLQSEASKDIIEDREQMRQSLDTAMQRFLRYKLPKLAYLGIVEATA